MPFWFACFPFNLRSGLESGIRRRILIPVLSLTFWLPVFAQGQTIEAAPTSATESGAPPFAVFGSEALGLSSPPTDLHLLPDGRLLVFAPRQIVLGDGVRWEVFRQAPDAKAMPTLGVQVDQDGRIFAGVRGGFSQVQFSEDGYWRLVMAAPWPATEHPNRPIPSRAIAIGNQWYWHSGSGAVIAWRPGQTASIAGRANMVESIFQLGGKLYLSERTEGALYRLEGGNMELISNPSDTSAGNAITAARPYDDHSVLVGTQGNGLQLFDGQTLKPFRQSGLLTSGSRINDLVQTEGNFYAAAVENFGVVFCDRDGHIVQVLDRTLDHRLARVKQLLATPGGILWGLVDDGVLRVQFPSRISNFEPIIGTGVINAHPFHSNGTLWVVTDGKTRRGVYDEDRRLTHMIPDTPAGRYVFSFSTDLGFPIAGTDRGAYYRSESGWVLFAPTVENLRVIDPKPRNGRWLFGARNEVGWLSPQNGGITIERTPAPGMGSVYNASTTKSGDVWLELGNGRLGRIRPDEGKLTPEIFDHRNGVPDGWAQIFQIGESVGFNIADQILRFDEPTERFLPDSSFALKYPGLTDVAGRPALDAKGRLWVAANGTVQVLEKHDDTWQNIHEPMPPGMRPFYFSMESNGVVWMDSDRHLARFDPTLPVAAPVRLRAMITHVDLVASNRTLFAVDHALPTLDFSDNSLNVHFLAPGNPFTGPVTFEVMLEGAGNEWVSTGGTGSAVFNRLKEGSYTLHVRPLSGELVGTEATLEFSIRPPWFRTSLAYALYTLSAFGVALLAIWLVTYLQRRENARLESIVTQRTAELRDSNLLLANQVDEIRTLSQAIGQSPVSVVITKPDGTVVFANPRAADLTGYAVTELVGENIRAIFPNLVSAEVIAQLASVVGKGDSWHGQLAHRRKDGNTVQVRTTVSPIRSPEGTIRLHLILEEDITEWLADQDRRRRLEAQLFQSQKLESIGTLAGGIAHDFNNILTAILGYCELARFNVAKGTELMAQLMEIRSAGLRAKDLVSQILTFSRQGTADLIPLELSKPVGEALRLVRASTPSTIAIETELESGSVRADSTQIQQVVLNLCTNAVHAIGDRPGRIRITLRRIVTNDTLAAEVPELPRGRVLQLSVEDNGHGMSESTLNRIFDPFFTTKQQGEGTGLGLSIVQGIMVGHQGALRVRSQPDQGTTFDLFFPQCSEPIPPPESSVTPPRGNAQEILVVDDEPSVGAFVQASLKHLGYSVVNHRDPRDALADFRGDPNRFQAIVTDLTMPHMTGIELIQSIRRLRRDIPAVIITGYGRDAGGNKLAAIPRCQVLYKPFNGEDLARILNLVMTSTSA